MPDVANQLEPSKCTDMGVQMGADTLTTAAQADEAANAAFQDGVRLYVEDRDLVHCADPEYERLRVEQQDLVNRARADRGHRIAPLGSCLQVPGQSFECPLWR